MRFQQWLQDEDELHNRVFAFDRSRQPVSNRNREAQDNVLQHQLPEQQQSASQEEARRHEQPTLRKRKAARKR